MGGPAFDHELARTEIAYKIGADRPDEAIKIIEGMKRDRLGRPVAGRGVRLAGGGPGAARSGREPSG